jgi:hypothetical protein
MSSLWVVLATNQTGSWWIEPSMDSIRDLIRDSRISSGSTQTGSRTTIFERKCVSEFFSDRLQFFLSCSAWSYLQDKKKIEPIGQELT